MTSQEITTTKNAAGQWEVRCKDNGRTLLGTFKDPFCRDLFIEALLGLVGRSDIEIEPLTSVDHYKKVQRPEIIAA